MLFKNVVAKDLLHKFQLLIAPYAYEQPLEWEEFKILKVLLADFAHKYHSLHQESNDLHNLRIWHPRGI